MIILARPVRGVKIAVHLITEPDRAGIREDRSRLMNGRYNERYVWVEPDGLEALTDFTLTVVKISSLVKDMQTLVNPGSVKFSPGDRRCHRRILQPRSNRLAGEARCYR
jgi:hypothetical protein